MPSLVSVHLSHIGETSGHDENGQQLTQTYDVLFDGLVTGLEAQNATGVPKRLSTLTPDPTGSGLKLLRKNPVRDSKNPNLWRVQVSYGVPSVSAVSETKPDGGGKWSKQVSVKGVQQTENTNRDVTKKPIKNSYGDVLPAELPKVFYDEEITISFLTDQLDGDNIAEFRGKVSANDYALNVVTSRGLTWSRSFAAFTTKFDANYSIELDSDGNPAWRVELVLYWRSNKDDSGSEQGWQTLFVDRGYRYFDSDGTTTIVSPTIVNLDGTGKKLADGANVKLLSAQMEFVTDFNTLFAGV